MDRVMLTEADNGKEMSWEELREYGIKWYGR
jgi:hypothetical protein